MKDTFKSHSDPDGMAGVAVYGTAIVLISSIIRQIFGYGELETVAALCLVGTLGAVWTGQPSLKAWFKNWGVTVRRIALIFAGMFMACDGLNDKVVRGLDAASEVAAESPTVNKFVPEALEKPESIRSQIAWPTKK